VIENDDETKKRAEDLKKNLQELAKKYSETICIWALALDLRDQDRDEPQAET
jgi:hypothetical protein